MSSSNATAKAATNSGDGKLSGLMTWIDERFGDLALGR